jgi:hypothetical protein
MTEVLVLGAEAQAATSIACAYPERTVTFVSDDAILDGSDLPNVRMLLAKPADREMLMQGVGQQLVPLCPRWLAQEAGLPLSRVFEKVEHHYPGRMLPVRDRPGADGRWIVKGDYRHRPDVPLSGMSQQLEDVTDPHGCGLVYQPLIEASATIMAIGRRGQGTQLGCIQIFDERFFWDNILQAGEAVHVPEVVAATLHILDTLDHWGFFTFNWLRTSHGVRLSSLRPVPRAIFQMFRCGGLDLLDDPPGVKVLRAGLRMIATPTYVSFRSVSP